LKKAKLNMSKLLKLYSVEHEKYTK
jgi:hypothetical protein